MLTSHHQNAEQALNIETPLIYMLINCGKVQMFENDSNTPK